VSLAEPPPTATRKRPPVCAAGSLLLPHAATRGPDISSPPASAPRSSSCRRDSPESEANVIALSSRDHWQSVLQSPRGPDPRNPSPLLPAPSRPRYAPQPPAHDR